MYNTIVFDLGGVFIQLTGVSTMLEWTAGRYTVDDLWNIWFSSKHVRLFETGKSKSRDFAREIIGEFGLPVDETTFLEHFSSWSNVPFPGSLKLLSSLKNHYQLVSLSNTNKIHWKNMCDNFKLNTYFDHNFPSHLTGKVKPELDTYQFVINSLKVLPEQIVFFDDNETNIVNARKTGIHAFRVNGIDELHHKISQLKLLSN